MEVSKKAAVAMRQCQLVLLKDISD